MFDFIVGESAYDSDLAFDSQAPNSQALKHKLKTIVLPGMEKTIARMNDNDLTLASKQQMSHARKVQILPPGMRFKMRNNNEM